MRGKRRIKRLEYFPPFIAHIRCYMCDNISHMAKDYKNPSHLNPPNQRTKNMQSRPNKMTIGHMHERE